MGDKVTNQLLLEHLEAIQSKLSAMANDIGDLRSDVRGLKSHMAGFMQSEVAQDRQRHRHHADAPVED